MEKDKIKVLMVDDDEDDYVIVKNMLSSLKKKQYELHWVSDPDETFDKLTENAFDVCLLDYRLGESDGLKILRDLWKSNSAVPVIVLTGYGDYNIDVEAMRLGAADYLEKSNLEPAFLERAIRHAIERSETLTALKQSEHRLRLMSAKLLEAQEDERKLLAGELHDSLGSSLTAIRYALEQNFSNVRQGRDVPEDISMERIIEMVKDTMEESRRITSRLRPIIIDDLGLVPALRSLVREFEKICSNVRTETQIDIREEEVPDPLKIVIFRIVQEALNNISKHSGADNVLLKLEKVKEGLELFVKDNGRGLDFRGDGSHESSGGGMGLMGMQERAELSNGTLHMWSEKGKGTAIRVSWQMDNNSG